MDSPPSAGSYVGPRCESFCHFVKAWPLLSIDCTLFLQTRGVGYGSTGQVQTDKRWQLSPLV